MPLFAPEDQSNDNAVESPCYEDVNKYPSYNQHDEAPQGHPTRHIVDHETANSGAQENDYQ